MNVSDKGAASGAGPSPTKWRILCIDDEPEVLSLLRTALSMRHEVVTAPSGVEALKIIGLCEPDFIICDIRMPNLDGYATVEAIRQHPEYADIPVFFLTAEKSRDAARRGFEVGCNLFLCKPFDPIRLLENIDYFTRESGHTVRSKSRALAELEHLLVSARRAPAPPLEAAPPKAAPQRPARPVAPSEPRVAAPAVTPSEAQLKAEHDAFLADRKRREREFWRKRYASIQSFIDQHMKD